MVRPGQPSPATAPRTPALRAPGPGYKWIALSNTTLGVLMASINASVLLIALPNIFRGIGLNPLEPGNSGLLLWLIMGYMVVTAVLVVSFGRLGDMYGRVRMYNLGFALFSLFSVLLSVTWMHGTAAALWLIIMRVLQGVGGAMLMANSAAILTDAFPVDQRGLALGLNQVAGIAGSFIGLILGGLLGPVEWHLVFLVSVPFGLFGTVWAYLKLRELGERRPVNLDWWGNLTFGAGLVAMLVGITYGIEPYGGQTMGWANPWVIAAMAGGAALLAAFCVIETRVRHPMFRMELFRIRAFSAGNLAGLLSGLGRGGLMFILIIWLQGIYLPRHGYAFSQTPLWAGIYMLPLTAGFLLAGPVSGILSDHFGSRPFASGGMLAAAASFALLELLPINFPYWAFALLLGMIVTMLGLGFPVALAFITTNILGWLFFSGWNPESLLQVIQNSTILISRFTLTPVPMFIMMGSLFFYTGLAVRVFDAIEVLFGRLPGRLAYMTVAGGALFATLTGSSMANTAMLGSLMVPEMQRRGYSSSMSMGPGLGSGGLAMIIPPSALGVLLAAIALVLAPRRRAKSLWAIAAIAAQSEACFEPRKRVPAPPIE